MQIDNALLGKIKLLSQLVWDRRASYQDISRWLDGIENNINVDKNVISNLLYSLEHFIFFSEKLVKALVVAMYRDLYEYKIIENIRKSNNDTLDVGFIDNSLSSELCSTRFIGIGGASESGPYLLYHFRKRNHLKKTLFLNVGDILENDAALEDDTIVPSLRDKSISHYVFIDDFCGSGDQSSKYLSKITRKIKEADPNVIISSLWLIATTGGLNIVRTKNPGLDNIQSVIELDSTFKTFNDQSRYYKNPPPIYFEGVSKDALKAICTDFGNTLNLSPRYWYGYEGCELLLAFHHNTPDNTLPIFWYSQPDKGLAPIFERDDKKY